jgi:hypothetical protein
MKTSHRSYIKGQGWSDFLPLNMDSPQTLVIVFGPSRPDAQIEDALAHVQSSFSNSVVCGCSSAGAMGGDQLLDQALSVAITQFERSHIKCVVQSFDAIQDSGNSARELAQELAADDLRAILLFSRGVAVNGSAIARNLRDVLPPGVVVCGGLAGDGLLFEQTWVVAGETRAADTMCAVGLYGDTLKVGWACDGGWEAFGPERRITKSDGMTLFDLDDRAATAIYKEYLGEQADNLPGLGLLYPLSIRDDVPGAPQVVRTIMGVDTASETLSFAGEMPVGAVARLMRTTVNQLVSSADEAVERAVGAIQPAETEQKEPVLAVTVSCIGRRLIMKDRADEEVGAVDHGLPAGSAHVGFYAYGVFGPERGGTLPVLHNQTVAVTIFSE